MESTHEREIAHAIRPNTKAASVSLKTPSSLYQKKEALGKVSDQTPHLHGFNSQDQYLGNTKSVLPAESDFTPGKEEVFLSIKHTKIQEDESVVSSTTNEKKVERSSSPCDSSTLHLHSSNSHQAYHHHYQQNRGTKVTETAAASSTTTCDDEEESLQMQPTSERGRRRAMLDDGRPPSCGTSLGVIKEGLPSSTTTEEEVKKRSKAGGARNGHRNEKEKTAEFLKPADVGVHPSSINQIHHGFGNSGNGTSLASGNNLAEGRADQLLPPNMVTEGGNKPPFDSRQMPMPMSQGISRSPILSDVSLIPLSPQPLAGMTGMNQFNPDLYMSGFSSPTMSMLSQARNLSPRHSIQDMEKMNHSLYGLPFNMGQTGPQGHMPSFSNGLPAQGMNPLLYSQLMQQHQQKLLAMSLEKPDELGRFPSPLCRSRARKRPLSISPAFSDGLDINTMIRTSPNSLLPYVNGSGLGHSRCSSAASGGSYGHLAAGGISPSGYLSGYNTPMMTSPQLQFFSRQMSMPGYMAGLQSGQIGGAPMDKADASIPNPFFPMGGMQRGFRQHPAMSVPGQNQNNPVPQSGNVAKNLMKHPADQGNQALRYNSSNNNSNMGVSPGTHHNNDDNEALYETNCEWEGCDKEFDTQEQLVQHINNDHIHGDKKEFACHWRDCAREKRPFKAQYMLVVHMRRHTGEKPHKCSFQGCSKAYSRLENLKTHLRSHTGEKPYMCEYPSCTKAFSNASDRAKHQNRTHSNEKPYVCKIAGCTKRYTDPSSLRKHVKTVHGPEAHVTKRMKATRERKERSSELNIKQEPGVEKEKKKSENENTRQHCHSNSYSTTHQANDSNPPSNLNPRSNQSSYTSGSDVTPQNSPHMTSQNNDSGVDVNVGVNDGDSDGDIVVDENPLPDSTSGGVSLQSRSRGNVRTSKVPRHFSKKMATLSLGGPSGEFDRTIGECQGGVDGPLIIQDRNIKQGHVSTEVSSTTLNSKLLKVKNYLINNPVMKHRQVALMNQDRRDSGTVSDVSRKSSSASQTSRKSSQISNVGINVAGSYDPISLDSSRRSSSNSTAPAMHYSGSAQSALNPYDLHHLQSKYSEMAGLPPPTPINGEPYSKVPPRRLKEEDQRSTSNQHGGNFHHRPNTFLPTPPPRGPHGENHFRRRSAEVYTHPSRTPQPSDVYGQARRASDPVRKASQMDPNKLPNVQRHNSWNNMTPLPEIQSRNSERCTQYYNNDSTPNNMQVQQKRNSCNNFYANENSFASQQHQQQHHQANLNQPAYLRQGGVNEQVLMNNLNADMLSACHTGMENMIKCHNSYGNMMSPGYPMSPSSHLMPGPSNLMSSGSNEMMQRSPMGRECPVVNTPMSYQNNSNPPMANHHAIASQQRFYDNNAQTNPNCPNPMMNGRMLNQHNMAMQHGPPQHGPPMVVPDQHMPCNGGFHSHHMQNNFNQQTYPVPPNMRPSHPHPYSNSQYPVPPNSMDPQYQSNCSVPTQVDSQEPVLTPRPPSHSASTASNRLRLTRMRHNSASMTSRQANPGPSEPASAECPTNPINSAPNQQIPDLFLQQDFIDSISELQPDPVNPIANSENPSFIKMAADSTTGPDGDIGDDNDDALSTTNTDVTLPPMSAFSSRVGTPLLNKPYPPQNSLTGGNHQHPASNMAISSMSSMLSTLEEENKYLSMMPPQ